jgi:hypothetical protein
MQTYEQTIPAGGVWSLHAAGRFFRIIEASNGPVDVLFFRNGIASGAANAVGAGYWTRPADLFSRIEITSASAQRVKIAIADGDGGYDVVGVTGVVNVADATYNKVIDNRCFTSKVGPVMAATSKSSIYELWNHAGSGRLIVIKRSSVRNGGIATSVFWGVTATQQLTQEGFVSNSFCYPGTASDIRTYYGNVTSSMATRQYREDVLAANAAAVFEPEFPLVIGEGRGFVVYDQFGNRPFEGFVVSWEEVPI